ncbi:phage tail tape measure protein [Avibacterium avium]|uniref:phage tail tape measure protein n=1 Tax=Avibacterium avium TaxID=751 RepID=UPI003BF8FBEA
MKNLELKVILNAVDKITSPLRGVQKQLDKLQGKVKGATDELNKLKQQEKTANSFKRLSDELQQSNHKLVKAKAVAKQLEQQLKNTVNPTAKLKKQVSDAYKQANKMAQAQEQQRKKLNQLRQSLRQGGFDTAKFKTSQQKLKEKIDQSTAAINKQNAAMKKLQQRQAQNKLYNNRVETLKNQSAFMASFGQRAVMHGLATVGTGGMLLKPAMNFEQEFSKVQALTGLNKANPEQAKQLERLRQQNIHLGATTSFTSDEVAQGQGYLAMAGFNAKQIEASMPAILNMTKAAGIEMGQVSDIASDISSGFKISANEMNRVADVLTATFTGSNTTLEGLGETMKYLGPIASATGQDFETMSAMVGLLGNVGIKGSQAGTSLRSAMLRLAGPPKQARKALNALGVSAKDSQGNMRALTDILVDVEKKTAKMGSGKKMEYYKAIFGAEAATAIVELVGQAGVNGIQEMTDKLKQSAGRAEQVAKVMSDNFWGDLKTLSSAKDALSISVFEVTSETLRDAAQKFTELLRKANEWVKANPKLVQAIVKWGAGIGIVLAAMGVLSLVISYTLFPFARLLLMINKYTGISKLFNFALVGTSKNLLKANKNLFSYKGTVSGLGRITAFAKQKLLSFGATLFSVIQKMKSLSFWVNLLKTTFRVAFSPIRMIAMGVGSAISFLLSPIKPTRHNPHT